MVNNSTKRALVSSTLAILMCVSMLIGTTFAWFTDTASTAVNAIRSGNLNVALEMSTDGGTTWDSAEGKTLQFLVAGAVPAEGTEILWEPGCTYELPMLRVVNKGNLALKYKIQITGIEGDAELNEAIEWTISDASLASDHSLAANAVSDPLTIRGHMKESAGNKYQGLSINGISVTVYATQDTAEKDSKDDQYDKNAAYKGSQEFTQGSHTLDKGGVALNPGEIAVKVIGAGTDLTITGGYYDGGKGGSNVCVAVANGASVTIQGGTFTVGGDENGLGNSVIYSVGGNITIEGGFFYTNHSYGGKYYVLNMNNQNPGTITVKGGTFVNFNPAGGDDHVQPTNFVADGYTVISETQANGDVWYTVVEGSSAGNSDDLAAAVENGGTVVLTDDVALSSPIEIPEGTDVTLYLNGKTVTATGNFVTVNAGSKLTVSGGTVVSGRYVFSVKGGEVVVDGGNFTAQETACALFGGSKLTVNDGTFTSKDNAVIATNGSSAEGCEITVNGGVFHANIQSAGYIACGIYVANKDTVKVNAGTFYVTDGVGILMRAGDTTIGADVVISLTNTGKVSAGRIGDATIDITTPGYLVMDVRSGYPGATAGFTITNNSAYELTEYR